MLDINEAQKFVKDYLFKKDSKEKDKLIPLISTSQIRKFLSAVNKINNKIIYQNDSDDLSKDIIDEIAYMRIQFAYIYGKDGKNEGLKKLHEKLDDAMKDINIKKKKLEFINFARYVEAIVAYHKYYDEGEENGR